MAAVRAASGPVRGAQRVVVAPDRGRGGRRRNERVDERSERLGQLFAVPAAIAVQNAQILAQTRRLAVSLQAALTSQEVIDQAIGIIRARSGISADEAYARLRERSQREHIKVNAVATDIVQEAVRQARARRRDTN